MPSFRSGFAAFLLVSCLSVPASAQVTVRQTWTPSGGAPQTCIFTTDANGIVMDANGALTMTGSYGANCPTGTVTPPSDPSITNGIDSSEIPGTTTAGAVHSITWSANADNCSYSTSSLAAPIATWPTTGNVCSDATSCASTHTVPITMPATTGSYTFALTCRKTGSGVVATSSRTAVIGGGGGSCAGPAGTTRAQSIWVTSNSGADARNVDATAYESTFGLNISGGSLRPFPGTVNLSQRLNIPRNNFVSMQFTVPSNLALNTRGVFRYDETVPVGGAVSMTVSKTCGDLGTTPTTPLNAKCAQSNIRAGDGLPWGYAPGDGATRCQLQPGETYYLNIIFASLTNPSTTPACGASLTCDRGIQTQFVSGSTWPSMSDWQVE